MSQVRRFIGDALDGRAAGAEMSNEQVIWVSWAWGVGGPDCVVVGVVNRGFVVVCGGGGGFLLCCGVCGCVLGVIVWLDFWCGGV